MITLNLLALAIGVGLLVTLFVTEAFGIAAGGLVVPGLAGHEGTGEYDRTTLAGTGEAFGKGSE